jgi:hypothetical protein
MCAFRVLLFMLDIHTTPLIVLLDLHRLQTAFHAHTYDSEELASNVVVTVIGCHQTSGAVNPIITIVLYQAKSFIIYGPINPLHEQL